MPRAGIAGRHRRDRQPPRGDGEAEKRRGDPDRRTRARCGRGRIDGAVPSAVPSTTTETSISSEIDTGDGRKHSLADSDGCRMASARWRGRDHRNDRYVERQ
ncbi:uncharacterized protein Nmag_3040A [Natrialba magadii ATCC 43099]|uniref:Uncharacterized protein n=1 Tax=Natrialba magadii (strain ATCC 43099 / DSM 3394 / CCM 3739 / CIP 104546 / IAM 13178 / JCM 8861 / NBRC 102185 / NCIMB 2190 / MS3) TaxID=547559 RepID=A0A1C9J6Y6_NATMM|nr:uncharacterized protein Nmag_3040A [Natrialba magadii ATCC 43099]